MDIPSTSQQTYIDEFNPKDYLQTSYAAGEGILSAEWTDFVLQNLHKTFSKGGVGGDTLLDVGTGASIYHLLSACEAFNKIIVSDLLEKNHVEFQKWLNKDLDAFDWNHIIKSVCELEKNRQDCGKKADKLRSKVKEVLKCDVLKRNPYDPVILPPVDCLLSCLCLEAACKDIQSYCNVLKKFKDLIKPEGHLLILGTLNATFYHAGKRRLRAMTVKMEEQKAAFKEAGYLIDEAVYRQRLDKSKIDVADFGGFYFIHACKPEAKNYVPLVNAIN